MTKLQWFSIVLSAAAFLSLLFGLSNRPPKASSVEKARFLSLETTDKATLLKEAASLLSSSQKDRIHFLENQLAVSTLDSTKIQVLKLLSGEWYKLGNYALAGLYAQDIATILGNDDEAWAIAGASFFKGIAPINGGRSAEAKSEPSTSDDVKTFCTKRAVNAFENAITLAPNEFSHRINLALCYIENPSPQEPMKGIQMLLGLLEKEPNNTTVLNHLGRLAIKTGQLTKAKERLEKSFSIEPSNIQTLQLLVKLYDEMQMPDKSLEFSTILEKTLTQQQQKD